MAPRTLLLADDSVTIQRVIELTFADEDIRVVAASDGDQAIALIDESAPDIVLADIGMPGRNGYEVARHVKNTPALAHIPVLLLAGAFEPIDHAVTARIADGVLAKPFEPQTVIDRVKTLLVMMPAAEPTTGAAEGADAEAALPVAGASTGESADSPAAALGAEVDDLDDYFERLDRAFAARTSPTPAGAPGPVGASRPPAAVADPPVRDAAPASSAEAMPPLADLFAALLAAERSLPAPTAVPAAPAGGDLVDQVARRVLERLPDRTLRAVVADLVSETAERLIREEIERIKTSIK